MLNINYIKGIDVNYFIYSFYYNCQLISVGKYSQFFENLITGNEYHNAIWFSHPEPPVWRRREQECSTSYNYYLKFSRW